MGAFLGTCGGTAGAISGAIAGADVGRAAISAGVRPVGACTAAFIRAEEYCAD